MPKEQMDLTPQQIRATELIGQGIITFKQVAKAVGVSEQTIQTWKQDSEFCEKCLTVARQLYRTHAPAVYHRLITMAKAGNMNAIKTYIEHMEVIDKMLIGTNNSSLSFTWAGDVKEIQGVIEVEKTDDHQLQSTPVPSGFPPGF